jgi:hypothetical protein
LHVEADSSTHLIDETWGWHRVGVGDEIEWLEFENLGSVRRVKGRIIEPLVSVGLTSLLVLRVEMAIFPVQAKLTIA